MPVIDLTWLNYFVGVVSVYYAILFLIPLVSKAGRALLKRAPAGPDGRDFLMVMVIPARNEERVIHRTLEVLSGQDHARRLVMVMDDGSTDRTVDVVAPYLGEGVALVRREGASAGQGKGAVLNDAYRRVNAMFDRFDPAVSGLRPDQVIIGVLDADGQLESNALSAVARYFTDPDVGGVQIGVRIANAGDNLLTRMQDFEFVGFSGFIQEARDIFGSVGLGGNGQFTRLSALQSLGRDPWTHCLTEDLELGLSLAEAGWRIRYCRDAFVAQQGLRRFGVLLRQRTRWVQGHYQCWSHVPTIVAAPKMRMVTKADLLVYLILLAFILLLAGGFVLGTLGSFGVVSLTTRFMDWLPGGPIRNALYIAMSFGPITAFLAVYQMRSKHPFAAWELPTYAIVFSLYAYTFVLAHFWAWARMATGRGSWAKTPRVDAETAV